MAIAAFNLTELNRTAYCTPAEVMGSSIAASLDFENLVPGDSALGQYRALVEMIESASVKADNYVYGPLGTICASVNVEPTEARPSRYGVWEIHPYYTPILEITAFSVGATPGTLASIPVSNSNVAIFRDYFKVTSGMLGGGTSLGSITQAIGGPVPSADQLAFVQYTYVNGFPNTFLSADVAANSATIPVKSSVGLYPGTTFTIWDAPQSENLQIANTYDGVSLTVPLTTNTQFSHSNGTNASCLPRSVKDAVIHFVAAAAKERGSGGIILGEFGSGGSVADKVVGSDDDEALGYDLLDDYKSQWGVRG